MHTFCHCIHHAYILMGSCKKDVTPLLMHWSYVSLALTHWYYGYGFKALHTIITWLRCFFPGFDRFIPGFDRFIPGFDRFIPASIPVTGTLPPPTIKNISSKKIYFLNLISSFFISLIWNNTIKKYSAMPRMHIFLKTTVNTNPKLFRGSIQCHRLSTVNHSLWQEPAKCCKCHAEDPILNRLSIVSTNESD